MLNLKWKSGSLRSKSQEKEAKYISAAIIPSVAFVINPTTSSEFPNLDESHNNLLTSTLNSSLLGLSQESIERNEIPKDKKKKLSKLRREKSHRKSQEDLQTNPEMPNSIRSRKRTKENSLKKPPVQTNNNKESKRHIEIANGLYEERTANVTGASRRPESPEAYLEPIYSIPIRKNEVLLSHENRKETFTNSSEANIRHVSIKSVSKPENSKYIKFDDKIKLSSPEIYEIPKINSDSEISIENDDNVEIFFQDPMNGYHHEGASKKRMDDLLVHDIDNDIMNNGNPSRSRSEQLPMSNEEIYHVDHVLLQQKNQTVGFEDFTEEIDNSSPSNINSMKYESHAQQNSGPKFMAVGYDNHKVNLYPESCLETEELVEQGENMRPMEVATINHNHMKQPSNNIQNHYPRSHDTANHSYSEKNARINDESKSSIKQMKTEIHLLQDTIYRLNMELSSQIPSEEPGRPIGKTIFPGKGPVPSWLMNTKYLAPLFVFHDKKCKNQSHQIQKIKVEIENFEREIVQIIKENERLHLRVQENQNGGNKSNPSDLQVIVQQAKLVIEENRLLLEELNLQQQKLAILENNNILEVAKLQKSLLSVSSERDALNEEIQNLTRRLAGVKGTTVQLSTLNQENCDNHLGASNESIYPSQLKYQETLIDELKNDKRKQELEIENLKQIGMKQERKIQKYRKVIESDQKFRDFFNGVLEKSESVVNERNSLLEQHSLINKEISRIIGKLTAEINYRTDLDVGKHEIRTSHKDQSDEFLNKLYLIESQMDLVLQHIEDLNEQCKSQKNEISTYQLQLKEKDIYIKECQNENDEMEEKLGYLLRNAENDNL